MKKKRKVKPHVIGTIHPKHIAAEEPHVVVAIPKSAWQKFQEWLRASWE